MIKKSQNKKQIFPRLKNNHILRKDYGIDTLIPFKTFITYYCSTNHRGGIFPGRTFELFHKNNVDTNNTMVLIVSKKVRTGEMIVACDTGRNIKIFRFYEKIAKNSN